MRWPHPPGSGRRQIATPEGLAERERLVLARFVRLYGRHGYP
jgi:hypothetical protein